MLVYDVSVCIFVYDLCSFVCTCNSLNVLCLYARVSCGCPRVSGYGTWVCLFREVKRGFVYLLGTCEYVCVVCVVMFVIHVSS